MRHDHQNAMPGTVRGSEMHLFRRCLPWKEEYGGTRRLICAPPYTYIMKTLTAPGCLREQRGHIWNG